MNKDLIDGMTWGETEGACMDIVGVQYASKNELTGLIIGKLQEWGCGINYPFNEKAWFIFHHNFDSHIVKDSLQASFLRTAQALGHWSPPKKVEAFNYWRNKISGSIVEMRPEFIGSMATHPEEWQRVTITLYKENNL